MSLPKNNNNDPGEDSRKLWPFFFIIPILGFSFLPITGSTADCTTNGLCYKNPSFWTLPVSTFANNGICTINAAYVQADNNFFLTINTPPSPPGSNNAQISEYVFYDFDVHVAAARTTGKISIYDRIFGLGFPLSREMIVAGVGLGSESGALQLGQNLILGPGTSDTFDLQIQRTAGLGSVCLDDWEGSAYVLAIGGTPA